VRWVPLARFVLNQDTGGAIRGAGRVDYFWGRGEAAAFAAGLMRQPGRLFFLVPRPTLAADGAPVLPAP
jgi:membrane-bound lytic murein transglycosylase A